MNKELKKELNELAKEDMSTSDLQGVVFVIAQRYNVDADMCLKYIYSNFSFNNEVN